MYCQRRQLSPVDVDGCQQKPRENRLESKRHEIVGTDPAKTKEIHVRDSTQVHAARENERTELTKAIATHFTSAYRSVGLEWPNDQTQRTCPPGPPFESTIPGGTRTPTGYSRKPCRMAYTPTDMVTAAGQGQVSSLDPCPNRDPTCSSASFSIWSTAAATPVFPTGVLGFSGRQLMTRFPSRRTRTCQPEGASARASAIPKERTGTGRNALESPRSEVRHAGKRSVRLAWATIVRGFRAAQLGSDPQ